MRNLLFNNVNKYILSNNMSLTRSLHVTKMLRENQPEPTEEKPLSTKDKTQFIIAGIIGMLAAVFLIKNDGFEGLYYKYISGTVQQQKTEEETSTKN